MESAQEFQCLYPSGLMEQSLQDNEMAITLLSSFVQIFPETIHKADTALAAKDWEALRKLLHQMKGSAGIFATPALFNELRVAEQSLLGLAMETREPLVRNLLMKARTLCKEAEQYLKAPHKL